MTAALSLFSRLRAPAVAPAITRRDHSPCKISRSIRVFCFILLESCDAAVTTNVEPFSASQHGSRFVHRRVLHEGCSVGENGVSRLRGQGRLPVRRFPSKLCASLDSSGRLRMDSNKHSISAHDLYALLGSDATPILIDVR